MQNPPLTLPRKDRATGRPQARGASQVILGVCLGLCFALTSLEARPIYKGDPRGQGGNLGVGVILGEPLGFSVKYFYQATQAIEVSMGYGYSHLDGFQISVDHLWHPHVLSNYRELNISWFLGVGPYIILADDRYRGKDRHVEIGPRVPVGLSFNFKSVPLDAFIQLAPGVNLAPDWGFRVDGGLGCRFYF